MKGAGTITLAAGGLPVLAAWLVGLSGLAAAHRPITDVLAEALAVLLLVLGWRFRRGRLVIAAVALALANFLVRGPLADAPSEAGLAAPQPNLLAAVQWWWTMATYGLTALIVLQLASVPEPRRFLLACCTKLPGLLRSIQRRLAGALPPACLRFFQRAAKLLGLLLHAPPLQASRLLSRRRYLA